MTDAEAIALAAAACANLQTAFNAWEANHPDDAEAVSLHAVLARVAARMEAKTGTTTGSFANPDAGSGK